MTTRLLVSPAGTGKSTYVAQQAQKAAKGLASTPIICVARPLQVRAMLERLSAAGGAVGVQVMTFDALASECLAECRVTLTEPGREVTFRVLQSTIVSLGPRLEHFGGLAERRGLSEEVRRLVAELTLGRIDAETFDSAIKAVNRPPRLRDIAAIYSAYTAALNRLGWTDRPGLLTFAADAVQALAQEDLACCWSHLYVDGFDDFTEAQLALLHALAQRVGRLEITLTGDPDVSSDSDAVRLAHRRFDRTRLRLEKRLAVTALAALDLNDGLTDALARSTRTERSSDEHSSSPAFPRTTVPALRHLERSLYAESPPAPPTQVADSAAQPITLIEAPDPAGEVRAALRWLKARIKREGLSAADVALLARDVEPYRSTVLGVAAEMEIPIRLAHGLPLAENPAVAALLDLLRLARTDEDGNALLARRKVIEAWRSPYFDWPAAVGAESPDESEVMHGFDVDADALDAIARWGRVIGGAEQWNEAFERLLSLPADESEDVEDDNSPPIPADVSRGAAAQALAARFSAFEGRITPPEDSKTRDFVRWLEAMIGQDPLSHRGRNASAQGERSLRIVAKCRERFTAPEAGEPAAAAGQEGAPSHGSSIDPLDVVNRDIAALEALKDVLRSLVAADEALAEGAPPRITYSDFVRNLVGAVEAAGHAPDRGLESGAVLLADVVSARGLSFRAVALIGLAEGEFPAAIRENPFLLDAERAVLRAERGLVIDDSTASAELEFFYEAITRPSERLLLTRPRLSDNGSRWKASPFWEEVVKRSGVRPTRLGSADLPRAADAASRSEQLAARASGEHMQQGSGDDEREDATPATSDGRALWRDILAGAEVVRRRARALDGPRVPSVFDGDLRTSGALLAERFGSGSIWSPSALETMTGCGFRFFTERALGLRAREEPAEGLGASQLGNIYHTILEDVYEAVPRGDRQSAETLEAVLGPIADVVLNEAPLRFGFRPTAWWLRTREQIVEHVRESVRALCEPEMAANFETIANEMRFGIKGADPLELQDGGDRLLLRGIIDRVDQAPEGSVRIIDYKTAGPSAYSTAAFQRGDKIQIALYALAARDALGLGPPAEGFYWHIQRAERSPFTLSRADGGVDGALETAARHAWSAVRAARHGRFAPTPPKGGCPDYCAAASFCWRYAPRHR